jgi:uncharacterized membrane protein
MEGNLLQVLDGVAFLVLIFGFCLWQIISTSRAKKRRIAREKAEKGNGA